MAGIPKYIGNTNNPGKTGKSALHAFTRNSNGDLLYTKITSGSVALTDGNGNPLYLEADIGTDDGSYSINTNGQLIYTFSENQQ